MRQREQALLAEILSSKQISDEIFGFHCQQAAEKLLKAMLSKLGINFPRTHNLRLLMDLLADAGHPLPENLSGLDALTPYGTLFRYEDIPAEVELDREALFNLIRTLHSFVENR